MPRNLWKYSCAICPEADTKDMVQCDDCDEWTHYHCANVTDEIEGCDWICLKCTTKKNQNQSNNDPGIEKSINGGGQVGDQERGLATDVDIGGDQNQCGGYDPTITKTQGDNQFHNDASKSINGGRLRIDHLADGYNNKRDEYNQNTNPNNGGEQHSKRDAVKAMDQNDKSSISTHSSSSRRHSLLLRRLEEERLLQAKRDADYLDKKYKLLEQFEEEDSVIEPNTAASFDAHATENWVRNQNSSYLPEKLHQTRRMNEIQTSCHSADVLRKVHFNREPIKPNINQQSNSHMSFNMRHPSATTINTKSDPLIQSEEPQRPTHTTNDTSIAQFDTLQPASQLNSSNNYQSFLSGKIGQTLSNINSNRVRNPIHKNEGLNSLNIAARQVTSRELPNFDGNPDDWPIFIANYETSTNACNYTDAENLIRLQKSLKGRALESVKYRLLIPESVSGVIETLKRLFGRPELILHSLLQKLRNEPAPKQDKLESIINFSLGVENICATMLASGLSNHLSNPLLLQELVDKLPANLKLQWGVIKQQVITPTLREFNEWLSEVSRAASEVTVIYQQSKEVKSNKQPQKSSTNNGIFFNTHSADYLPDVNTNTKKCCICQGCCESVEVCSKFKNLNHKKRWDAVKKYHLCRTCLQIHGSTRCKIEQICGKNNCIFKHNRLLHNDKKDQIESKSSGTTQAVSLLHNQITVNHKSGTNKILFRVVPVSIVNGNIKYNTFAFLDDGSSVTLIDEEVANELGLEGEKSPLCLKWTSEAYRVEENSRRVSFNIMGTHAQAKISRISAAYTVSSLGLPWQSVNARELKSKYPYLKDIPLPSYKNAHPRILIGLKNWKLGVPLKVKEGDDLEPIATKTRLGWTICGPINDYTISSEQYHHRIQMCDCLHEFDAEIHKTIKNYFSFDSLGVSAVATTYCNESNEDQRARQIMKSTVCYKDGRYEIGLLWRYDDVRLPNNYISALKRLQCLEKRLAHDPSMKIIINEQIKTYIEKGYVHKLSVGDLKESTQRTWYLPIFPVINKNKPDKVRIVWDAASKVNGVCLNSVLLKGPDLLSSLPGILIRFREGRFAVSGDIQEMFHQITVKKEDRNVQRFLWRSDPTNKPDVYVMNVLTFGASCSPCCSQFIKNHHAQQYSNSHPRAALSITRNHYVDDLLDSVDSEIEAVELIENVKMIHEKGGFHMRHFRSNSKLVTEKFSVDMDTKKNLSFEANTEKVLGMWWCTESDTFLFSFTRNATINEWMIFSKKPTKRQLLRVLMSTFDPLGLLANYLVYLKILLQDVWKTSIGWDEHINDSQFSSWKKWIKLIDQVEQIRIPRCLSSKVPFCDAEDVQLHMFVDASEKAYAAVAFLRIQCHENIDSILLGAKTRVSPMKPTSIPRLELQAALLGARYSQFLQSELSIKITKCVFWSDSKTVICWIRSTTRRFRQFVSYRIGEILELTDISQWKWIPSSQNVADEATKWSPSIIFQSNSRWYNGPSFLRQPEKQWPPDLSDRESTDEEILLNFHHHSSVLELSSLIDFSRFSRWERLKRTQLFINRFIHNAQARLKNQIRHIGLFSSEEIYQSEVQLYRQAQLDEYSLEMKCLLDATESVNGKFIDRRSKIYRLTPYIDEDGLLRVGGRVDAANGVNQFCKRPIILPRHHQITKLVLHYYHRIYHHANQETVVNEVRQKFSIPQLRVAIKSVIRNCQFCKNRSATPIAPLMGSLPPARLTSYTRPFSFVGLDYFGPMNISIGRRSEKRWVMLATCMSTRAVHMEVVHSLTTDSCILAFRNFVSRRGQPLEIHSDNGTNFHGMNNELKSQWDNVDKDRLSKEFTSSTTKWIFIPPGSPHMGGSWERLIQSTKKVLNLMKPSRNPSDELLRSILCEIENILNSRPLTYIPIDDENAEALTPNHFLLGSSSGVKPIGEFSDESSILKKNWMVSQQLTNFFWRRWVREYLPTLTRRTKWFQNVKSIQEGDLVVIIDERSSRNTWTRGKILQTYPGKDGIVRSAAVQTQHGIYHRPIVKLAVLDVTGKIE